MSVERAWRIKCDEVGCGAYLSDDFENQEFFDHAWDAWRAVPTGKSGLYGWRRSIGGDLIFCPTCSEKEKQEHDEASKQHPHH